MSLEPWIEKDKRRGTYVVRWRDAAGVKHRDDCTYDAKEDARKRRDIIRVKLTNRSLGQVDSTLTIQKCVDAFVAEQQGQKSAERLHCYREAIAGFLRSAKISLMGQIQRKAILDFKTSMYERKYSEHTIHMYLGVLSVWLKWAKLNEWIAENPYFEIHSPVPRQVDRFLTNAEVLAMEKNIKNREFRAIFRLGYMVGMRPGEILKMKSDHLVWDKEKNLFALGIPPENTKTGTGRMVALPQMVVQMLPRKPGVFFDTWSRERVGRHFLSTLKLAGLPAIVVRNKNSVRRTFYWTRHTYARLCLEKRMDLGILMVLMGHNSIKMTKDTYGHLEKTFVIDQAHALNALPGHLESALICGAPAGQESDNVVNLDQFESHQVNKISGTKDRLSDGKDDPPSRAHSSIG